MRCQLEHEIKLRSFLCNFQHNVSRFSFKKNFLYVDVYYTECLFLVSFLQTKQKAKKKSV